MHPRFLTVALALLLALGALPGVRADEDIADAAPGVAAEKVWEGLDMPVDIAFGPDGTLYYVELQSGGLRALRPGQAAEDAALLWSAPNLQIGGERGVMGLALDPDFAESGAFYVYYTHNESGTITGRLSRVVEGQEEVVHVVERTGVLHNSGRIAFLPDGTLLLSVGDAVLDTAGREASMHAHDESDENGKVLRMTRDGEPAADNPWGNFAWTKGHRNVYGLAVSPDGMVIGTENGPETGDEINVLEPGNDYGWPTCAGPCGKPGYAEPVVWWDKTVAPTGATWHGGSFYFSTFNSGGVYRLVEPAEAGGEWTMERAIKFASPRVLDIESGPDGLYASSWDTVWRITGLPQDGAPATPGGDGTTTPTVDATTPTGPGEGGEGEGGLPDGRGEVAGGGGGADGVGGEASARTPGPGLAAVVLVALPLALALARAGPRRP